MSQKERKISVHIIFTVISEIFSSYQKLLFFALKVFYYSIENKRYIHLNAFPVMRELFQKHIEKLPLIGGPPHVPNRTIVIFQPGDAVDAGGKEPQSRGDDQHFNRGAK